MSISQLAAVVFAGAAAGYGQLRYVGSAACATCHQELAAAYRNTAMARTSGKLSDPLPPGTFWHAPSRTRYQIENRTVRFGATSRDLSHYIGSGRAGRSFLLFEDGFLFLAPVTWYAQATRWDVSPGYEQARQSLWNRPVEPNCLFCHATRAQPVYGTQNRYADPPFAEGGIGCERCHGPGSGHLAAAGQGQIVNPARLAPARRDAVCAQCHLTGLVRIDQAGRQLAEYRPGMDLWELVAVFVAPEASIGRLRVTSHGEKLSYSRCRQASGETLWCGTCHPVHEGVPAEGAARAAWFRSRCLSCHQERLEPAHAARDGCTGCHMPRTGAEDANHGVFTDHSIPRRAIAAAARVRPRAGERLTPFGESGASERTLGLAYAERYLETGDPWQRGEARRLLRLALPAAGQDWNVLTRLAYLEDPERAIQLYERSLALRPGQPAALVNAGVLRAQRGELPKAVEYWRQALALNPGLTEASRNLAQVLRALGQDAEAARVLGAASRFAPEVER